VLEVEVAELEDVEGLVSEDLSGVVLEDLVKGLWQFKLLSVLARHYSYQL